jgi:uncharacterized phiE125 gp8 family phage protein
VDNSYDGEIQAAGKAARRKVEEYLGRALIEQTRESRIDFHWPAPAMELGYAPLMSVESVKYIDSDGVEQTLTEDTDYSVDTWSEPGRVYCAYDTSWPSARCQRNAITITFKAGATAGTTDPGENVRPDWLHAIKMWTKHFFDMRDIVQVGASVATMPEGIPRLLDGDRIHPIGRKYA